MQQWLLWSSQLLRVHNYLFYSTCLKISWCEISITLRGSSVNLTSHFTIDSSISCLEMPFMLNCFSSCWTYAFLFSVWSLEHDLILWFNMIKRSDNLKQWTPFSENSTENSIQMAISSLKFKYIHLMIIIAAIIFRTIRKQLYEW